MTRTRSALALAAALAALAGGGTAVAADDCRTTTVLERRTGATTELEVCRADRWITGSATKADNVASAPATWDETKPEQSVRAGAGAGHATVRLAEIVMPFDQRFRPLFQGSFTGVLDNLAADLYLTAPVYQSTGTPYPLLLTVEVDGIPVFSQEDAEIDVPIEPNPTETTGTGATNRIRFAVTGIAQTMKDFGMTLEGEHTVSISVINRYWGDGHTVFLYDTTEVPAGVVFNAAAADLTPYTRVSAS